jgi:S-DNA-T family DNA segregation ATPase FtsK/SpoIIIE
MQSPKITSIQPFPPVCLLEKLDNERPNVSQEEIEKVKTRIAEILEHFEISFIDIEVQCGLAYTSYKIRVAHGTRVTKIMDLEEEFYWLLQDFGRARLNVPLPYNFTFSLEMTNVNPQTVSLRTLIESDAFQKTEAELPVALGVTIDNEPVVMDLVEMHSLLIGGAVMQGKRVCLHNIILSLLYKKRPNELKFVIIDPLKYKFHIYNELKNRYLANLPSLEPSVITEIAQMGNALQVLLREMDRRYDLIRNAQTRNIREYNASVAEDKQLPNIVLIVDEFVELFLEAEERVETVCQAISNLAILGRAIGIHPIITTSRIDCSIIPWSFLWEFSAHIAFRVATGWESLLILHNKDATSLNSKGDMLLDIGSNPLRLQGALVTSEDIERVVEYVGELL